MNYKRFIEHNIKEYQIIKYITDNLKTVGHSHTKLQITPLGEKIIIHASRPGLIVGRKGQYIKKLTKTLKKRFGLENPQIEISEVENVSVDAQIVAERISNSMERFGSARFKGIGHKAMEEAIRNGALGIEILISGKIPSSRAKRWRFYQGYLKKCGNLAVAGVHTAYTTAELKTGTVGIQVRIMPADIELPDRITLSDEVVTEESVEEIKEEPKKKKRAPRKKKADTKEKKPKSAKKKTAKKESEEPAPKAEEKPEVKEQPNDQPAQAEESKEE